MLISFLQPPKQCLNTVEHLTDQLSNKIIKHTTNNDISWRPLELPFIRSNYFLFRKGKAFNVNGC